MKNILHLFKRDVQNVSRSVIGMVVVMGLIIVPCLYAWFNIAGSWDPYGNTGNLKIAVVNTDEGYESDLIPVEVNVGENVTATLRGNDRDKAIEGNPVEGLSSTTVIRRLRALSRARTTLPSLSLKRLAPT